LNANTFIKDDYDFDGWAETEDGSKKYNDKQRVVNLTSVNGATINLYALWKEAIYTVTFDPNGGTGGPTPVRLRYGDTFPTPLGSKPAKTGNMFLGYWNSAED
jgi:uncharacterized repeat protein (TIGR02543 family)